MKYHHHAMLLLAVAITITVPDGVVGNQAPDTADLDAIYKIKDEGFERSKVMEVMSYLTDIYGPRLTNSPNIKAAAKWTTAKMTEWGLVNVKPEPWGPFGRGWSNEKFYLHAIAPQKYPVIGFPKAWSPGTDGLVTGDAVIAVIASEKDIERYRGKLHGKFVLTAAAAPVAASFAPLARRYDDNSLDEVSRQPAPVPSRGRGTPPAGGPNAQQDFNRKRVEFLVGEGILATLEPSRGVNGGTVFVTGVPALGGRGNVMSFRDPKAANTFPQLVLAAEHYNRMWRTLEKNIPMKLE